MRLRQKIAAVVATTLAVTGVTTIIAAGPAAAHGAMTSPGARTYLCYEEGPLAPTSPACKTAVATSGSQPLYDWYGVLRSDGAGRTVGYIPDGKLCSGGSPKYAGFDNTDQWPTTTMTSGAPHRFTYRAWAAHPGSFKLWVTKDGFDASKPLKWSDLEAEPFETFVQPALSGGDYVMDGQLPANKLGRHIIYSVWQRSDSSETFYNCSDVVFQKGSTTPPPPKPPLTCEATVTEDSFGTGFGGSVTIKNTSTRGLDPWGATWKFPVGVKLDVFWNAELKTDVDGRTIIASPTVNNRTLAPGGSIQIGFNATGPAKPLLGDVRLAGVPCTTNGVPPPTTTPPTPPTPTTPPTTPTTPPTSPAGLQLLRSTNGSHTGGSALDKATVSGTSPSVAAYVPDNGAITSVAFSVDGKLVRTEAQAPYDLGGTAADGTSTAYPLGGGATHVVSAVVTAKTGTRTTLTATVSVSSNPTPTPGSFSLLSTGSGSHDGGTPLDGRSVAATGSAGGPVTAYVPDNGNVAAVVFSVDGTVVRTEKEAPYDLGGTGADKSGVALTLAPGAHTVTAVVTPKSGPTTTLSARVTVTGGTSTPTPTPSPTMTMPPGNGAACTMVWKVEESYPDGFKASMSVTSAEDLDQWMAHWEMPAGTKIVNGWNATVSQDGSTAMAEGPSWDRGLTAGKTVSVGLQGTGPSTVAPTMFQLNGTACAGGGPVSPTPTATPTTTPTTSPAPAGCGTAKVCDGFETQTGTKPTGRWTVTSPSCSGTGTVNIDRSVAHSGTTSVRVNGGAGFCDHVWLTDQNDVAGIVPAGGDLYGRFWVRHTTALPSGHTGFMAMRDGISGGDLRFGGQGGALQWNRQTDDATLPIQSPAGIAQSKALPTGTWQCVAFQAGANGIRTSLNGTLVPGLVADGTATPEIDAVWGAKGAAPTDFRLGWENYNGGADTLWFDDVALGSSPIGC